MPTLLSQLPARGIRHRRHHHRALLCTLLTLFGLVCLATASLPAGETAPDPEATRKDIDTRIAQFTTAKKSASLGLIKEIINLSINVGAGIYDDGDHEGCYTYYVTSIDALLTAFGKDDAARPEVKQALNDLQAARESAKTYPDVGKKAWALRYAFDKILIAWGRKSNHQTLLVGLGSKYFRLGLYTQAEDAFKDACDELAQVAGVNMDEIDFSGRLAPMAYSRSLLSRDQFGPAADRLNDGLHYLPEWPTYAIDPVQFYGDEADHTKMLHHLEAAVEKDPTNIGLTLLLGAEYFVLNHKEKARTYFQKVADSEPDNASAAAFLKTYLDSDYQKDLTKTIALLNSSDRKTRLDAFTKLIAAGRWALPSLMLAKRTASNAQTADTVQELLRRLGEDNTDPGPKDQEY